MALNTVADYSTDVRTLVQDTVPSFRYTDLEFLVALNVTLMEMRRLRADVFLGQPFATLPQDYTQADTGANPYVAANDTTDMTWIDQQFRLAVVLGIVAHLILRDQEDVQDARSSAFMQGFNTILVGGPWGGIQQAIKGGK
jgi:hypothetical protein